MGAPIGKRVWVVADGYIPGWSHGPKPQMESHESLSILNVSDEAARIRLTVFFKDREPAGPYELCCGARRSLHVRLNNLHDPEPIPRDTEFSTLLESDTPVVVQHTRLDSRQAENALISTMAYAAD